MESASRTPSSGSTKPFRIKYNTLLRKHNIFGSGIDVML